MTDIDRLPLGECFTIRWLIDESHNTSKAKGWHDEPRSFGDLVALVHSELSEALEAYRDPSFGSPAEVCYTTGGKPEGVPSELADAIIRIADICGRYGIDLERAIIEKAAYNRTRPHRHGGKRL